ncbi:hypothetical protein OG520_40230 (plasmid) [Streptomyces sp. NBC_00984]|nr:hypothetical protein OG520_40230 [Streptomyces sp. NBC_00984]
MHRESGRDGDLGEAEVGTAVLDEADPGVLAEQREVARSDGATIGGHPTP